MPLPPHSPLPIPQSRRAPARPARSPLGSFNKAGRENALVAEARADMASLPLLSYSSTTPMHGIHIMRAFPGSAPTGIAGIAGTLTPPLSSSSSSASPLSRPPAREVSLASLMDGRGRRKRVGEATERGFDFIPRPDVRALKDEDTPATPATAPQTVNVNAVAWPTATPGGTPGGKTTLGTPALVPCTPEDEEDDDWEHVHHEDEEPEPVVGELELDLDDPELGLGTAGTPGRKHTYTTVAMAVRNM